MTTEISPLLVVLVNFRTPDVTIQCLKSLAPEVADLPGTRVVVADNASGDGSVPKIEEAVRVNGWSAWARVVPLERNGGFAWGNNRGIEAGGPARYVLLLNNDTVVHRGCLSYCVRAMDADPTVGAMSCKLLNADGSIQVALRRFPSPLRLTLATTGLPRRFPRLFGWARTDYLGDGVLERARDGDWIGGAFLFVRGELMARLRGLDDEFFFYGEDIAFCNRVWREGFRCRYDPGAVTTHLGGASSDPARLDPNARSLYFWQGRYLVQRRCYGKMASHWVRVVDLVGYAARMSWMRLVGRRGDPAYQEMSEIWRLLSKSLKPKT